MSSNPITERITSRLKERTGDDIRPVLSYLGPAGTYSHQVGHSSHPLAPVLTRLLQAALDRFAETVHYCALDTISGPYARNFLNQL
jgi:hypothetical protein